MFHLALLRHIPLADGSLDCRYLYIHHGATICVLSSENRQVELEAPDHLFDHFDVPFYAADLLFNHTFCSMDASYNKSFDKSHNNSIV